MNILELGHVVLYVRDIATSATFYRDTLGFQEIARAPGMAVFSAGRTHHELLLIEVGGTTSAARGTTPGLYHIGFKVGNGPESLQLVYRELSSKGVRILGATDHGVTHSLYILDPDDNELELYADVSDEWRANPGAIMAPARALPLS